MMSRESCGKLPGKHENCPWSKPSFWKLTETFIFAKHLVEVAPGFTNQNRVANMECGKKQTWQEEDVNLIFSEGIVCPATNFHDFGTGNHLKMPLKVGQIEFTMRIWDVLNKPKQNYVHTPSPRYSFGKRRHHLQQIQVIPYIQIPQVKILNLPDHTQRFPQDLHLHLRHLSSNAASDVKLVLSFASKGASRRPPSHLNHLLVKKRCPVPPVKLVNKKKPT